MWHRVVQPTNLVAALHALAQYRDTARIVAGGTNVLVEVRNGVPATTLIDISALREIKYVRREGATIAIGGLATLNDLLVADAIRTAALPLAQACLVIGAPQIRARATITGNLATAAPDNDAIAPLMVLDAALVLARAGGERTVPIADFFTGFGRTQLQPDELIREIRFRALDTERRGLFLKLALRRAKARSVVALACVIAVAADGRVAQARIALGCLAPTVVRARLAEAALIGRPLDADSIAAAARAVLADAAPVSDVRSSAHYRRSALGALATSGLERLADGREADGFPVTPVLLQTPPPDRLWPVEPFVRTIVTTINGEARALPDAERKTLLDALREDAGLTGTKEGCAEGECGACTVWLDGAAVFSCLVPAVQAHGAAVTTIEGLAADDVLHPLQQSFIDCGAVQCGFCTPGMIMAGAKLLNERCMPSLDDQQAAISGNICRCTGYRKILDAMTAAAQTLATREPVPQTVTA